MALKLDKLAKDFHRFGFAVIEEFMSEAEMRDAEAELDRLMRAQRDGTESADFFFEEDGKSIRQIERVNNHSQFFAKFNQDERFAAVMQQLFGEDCQGDNLSYMAKAARIGAGAPAHQDNAYYCLKPPHALTFWIALDDSKEENGCVRVVPGSHLEPLVAHQPSGDDGLSQSLVDDPDPQTEVPLIVKRGNCSIHHCRTIHRSLPNTSARSRRALLMFARSVASEVDQECLARYHAIRQQMYDRINEKQSKET